jgi:hypothetical protein
MHLGLIFLISFLATSAEIDSSNILKQAITIPVLPYPAWQ